MLSTLLVPLRGGRVNGIVGRSYAENRVGNVRRVTDQQDECDDNAELVQLVAAHDGSSRARALTNRRQQRRNSHADHDQGEHSRVLACHPRIELLSSVAPPSYQHSRA